jgi:hypothetical protein
MQRIEYARREAAEAFKRAAQSTTPDTRAEWLVAAEMWEGLVRQYEVLSKLSELDTSAPEI